MTVDEAREWQTRAEGLSSEIEGAALHPHEIEFLERFERRGHKTRWIPESTWDNNERLPRNDFVWLDRDGLFCELKTSDASYRVIENRIRKAVRGALRAGVEKQNFVIDLGKATLGATLITELELYNAKALEFSERRPQYGEVLVIMTLFVMADDGAMFREIDLQ